MAQRDLYLTSLNYFTQGVFNTFITTYLALYLLYNTAFSRGQISILLLIAPIPLLIRPYFGKLLDNFVNPRLIFSFGIGIYLISLLTMGINTGSDSLILKIIPVFGAYMGLSIFDSVGDKYMTLTAKNDATSSVIWMSLSQTIARTIVSLFFVAVIGGNLTSNKWILLFSLIGITALPLTILGLIKYPQYLTRDKSSLSSEKKQKLVFTPEMKRSIGLIIALAFVVNIRSLADIVFEPYFVEKFGADAFVLFNYYLAFTPYISLIVYPIAYKYKIPFMKHRIFWIISAGIYSLIFWIVLAGTSLRLILLFTIINPIFSSILYLSYISIFVDGTPPSRENTFYQIYSTAFWIAGIGLGSLGMALTQWLPAESILLITGLLLFSGLFVIPKIKLNVFQISLPTELDSQKELITKENHSPGSL
jgi:MFS family permease